MNFREPRGASPIGNFTLSKEELDTFLNSTPYCTLSFFSVNGYPGVTPINYAWDGEYFYVHCAKKGERFESLAKNPKVSICVYEPSDNLHQYIADHKSVVAYGDAELLTPEESVVPLQKMCLATAMPHKAKLEYIEKRIAMIVCYRIKPLHIIGRIVKFGGIQP